MHIVSRLIVAHDEKLRNTYAIACDNIENVLYLSL